MSAHTAPFPHDAAPGSAAAPAMPIAARWLGIAGVVPFFALLGALVVLGGAQRGLLLFALVGYGAIVLTFVGALHWAFAMILAADQPAACTRLLVWSVVPALSGWAALILPTGFDLVLLVSVFWVHFGVDVVWAHRLGLPAWYGHLRTVLTVGATLALTLAIGLLLLTQSSAPDLLPAQMTCPIPGNGVAI